MTNLYVIGDTHGDLSKIYEWVVNTENSTLIHVGDACIPLINLEHLAYKLNKKNSKIYIVRGNHESNEYSFDGQVIGNGSITLVKDYSNLEIEGRKVLFIGGAISLDRKWRRAFRLKHPTKENWFNEDEALKYRPDLMPEKADILVTHTAHPILVSKSDPNFLRPFAQEDDKLMSDLEKERDNILNIYDYANNIGVTKSFFGHWHFSERGQYKNINYRGLGINEIINVQ